MQKPNLFIIGAPKCGTTSFANYLNQHPKIFVSKLKEPHYFNRDSKHRFAYTEEDYLQYFNGAQDTTAYRIDASVWYLYSKVAANEILKFNPDAKFIVMIRNPVEMYFSLYQQLLFSGEETIKSPSKAWKIQYKRKKGENIPVSCYDKSHLYYKEVCSLGSQIKRLKKNVSAGKIHFINFDDLKRDPNKTFNETLQFLNLPPLSLENYKIYNKKKERKSHTLAYLLKIINKIKQKINFRGGLGIANFLERKNRKKFSGKYEKEFEALKLELKKEFYNDIGLLEQETGFDLTHWK